MDRREMLGMGLAGALTPGAVQAQSQPGYLPGDSQEFVALWPGTPLQPALGARKALWRLA